VTTQTPHALRRILGLGFGVALAFGCTIGVGILRLPGTVAAALGDRTLIMAFWALGGLYALMGAVAVAELAAMLPETGGFRVYARRAFGDGTGFAVGWCDWLTNVASLSYVAITVVTYLGDLWPATTAVNPTLLAVVLIVAFSGIHWIGLRTGSAVTEIISVIIALLLLTVVAGCLLAAPARGPVVAPLPHTAATLPWMSVASVFAAVTALRAILTAFDGWYSPIYMAEESVDPVRTLPRAIIGGTLLIAMLYLVINFALVRVLPLPVLAHSVLPAADAARIVLPRGGAEVVTVISIFTMLSLLNSVMLSAPRILFAIGRDGLFTAKAALVSKGGTPRVALLLTSALAVVVILICTFEQIIAIGAVLFLVSYASAFLAVFVLRYREPALPRPFEAVGYPVSTAVVLAGSLAILIAAAAEDPRSARFAVVFLSGCIPFYLWVRGRRVHAAASAPEGPRGTRPGGIC
jgi:basic amino acid/polyamine antiporter, APA family